MAVHKSANIAALFYGNLPDKIAGYQSYYKFIFILHAN